MAESSGDRPVLLVASMGGHLTQLVEVEQRLSAEGRRRWVTFDGPQSRSLLADGDVTYIPYIPPRGYRSIAAAVPSAVRLLRDLRPGLVVSTGSGIALAFLPAARLLGFPTHYLESATRAEGPSTTGRILARVPGISLHTQHPAWAGGRWDFVGSVFEGYHAVPTERRPVRRAVVTLGTMETYTFERLVRRLVDVLPPDADVLWQTGATAVSEFGIDGLESVPTSELESAIARADVVVAHAGTGAALTCLGQGRRPVLVPRESARGEHVDDHQAQTAAYLSRLELAEACSVDDLTPALLEGATAWTIERSAHPPAIDLG